MNDYATKYKMFVSISVFQIDDDDECLSTDIPSLVEDFLKDGLKKVVK
jgi:hypothetical protein